MNDFSYFLETLAGNFMDVVQYNEDNRGAEQLAEAVAQTNGNIGGYDIRSSRIVFPNGSIDPGMPLGNHTGTHT
ncbi:thymus-specific serine protease [Lates japonicus]|uniref:Thymus-specific serine protease n=1 Tax=Lates japonicus TaxID=270547 RepID=A0AAD3R0N7_LATJO|nr:thymus-specific serine protease [Lates japonicus]